MRRLHAALLGMALLLLFAAGVAAQNRSGENEDIALTLAETRCENGNVFTFYRGDVLDKPLFPWIKRHEEFHQAQYREFMAWHGGNCPASWQWTSRRLLQLESAAYCDGLSTLMQIANLTRPEAVEDVNSRLLHTFHGILSDDEVTRGFLTECP